MTDQASKVLGRIRRDDTSRDEDAYVLDAEDVVQIKQKIDVCLFIPSTLDMMMLDGLSVFLKVSVVFLTCS